MNNPVRSAVISITMGVLASLACSGRGSTSTGGLDPMAAASDAAATSGARADDAGGAGGSGEAERSDLDRSVEELTRLTCEHHKRTYQCDECRYEVGVARAPQSLIEEGLLKVVEIGRRRAETSITLTGEMRFDERRVAHLSPQTEGIIRAVHVSLGQHVEKDQALIELDSIALGQAQSEYLEALSASRLLEQNFNRQAELLRAQITSEKEYLEARQEFEAAEIRAKGAREKLLRLGTWVEEAGSVNGPASGEAHGRLVLRAPLAGTVLRIHAVNGETAQPGESIMEVGDVSQLWLWADLYERDLAAVTNAQTLGRLEARASVKAFPTEEFSGTVDLVDAVMDESSRTIKVRISVPNADGRLRAGMFAKVRLLLPAGEEVLAVPSSAVLEDEGRSFIVRHLEGDYYIRRPVKVGRTWDGWVEITEGLTGAERVVTDGCFLLKSDILRSKMGAGCAD